MPQVPNLTQRNGTKFASPVCTLQMHNSWQPHVREMLHQIKRFSHKIASQKYSPPEGKLKNISFICLRLHKTNIFLCELLIKIATILWYEQNIIEF